MASFHFQRIAHTGFTTKFIADRYPGLMTVVGQKRISLAFS